MSRPDENDRFVYEFGRFVVDPLDKTIVVDGRSIQLPAKEFETLLLLIENNGRVVTKSDMMSALWQDTFVEEGNLATYISRLRKIVNKDGEKLIETVPKLGYRFTADLRKNFLDSNGAIVVEKRTIKTLEVEIDGDDADDIRTLGPRTRRRPVLVAVAFMALVLIAVAAWFYWKAPAKPATTKIASIAVLPFHSISTDDNGRALGLGITDALISKIGSVHRVVVRPTSAVARFSNSEQDSIEIGKKLNVDAVLDGTIQQADGRLRINTRLLRVQNGEQMWTEKFDEAAAGIFDIEDRLSAKIANTLSFELTNVENRQFARRGTRNTEAYEMYLRGRFYQRQNTAEGLSRSIELYQQAIALDPKFADAHAGIADAALIMYNFGLRPASEVIPRARESIKRALELSPDLAEAYTSRAMIQFLADHDWKSAEESLQTAISLNPSNADAYHRYGYFLTNIGEFDAALEKFEQARKIDPLSPIVQTGVGLAYLYSRRFTDAITQFEKIVAENPDFSMPQWFLATSYESLGENEKAFETSMRALVLDGDEALANRLRSVKETKGLAETNTVWLNELLQAKKNGKGTAIDIAWRYATLGDRENTLEWLERSFDEGEPTIAQIKFLAKYDVVRDDLRFKALENKLGF